MLHVQKSSSTFLFFRWTKACKCIPFKYTRLLYIMRHGSSVILAQAWSQVCSCWLVGGWRAPFIPYLSQNPWKQQQQQKVHLVPDRLEQALQLVTLSSGWLLSQLNNKAIKITSRELIVKQGLGSQANKVHHQEFPCPERDVFPNFPLWT